MIYRKKCLDRPQLFKKGCNMSKMYTVKVPGTASVTPMMQKYLRLPRGLYDQSSVAEKGVPRLYDKYGRSMDVHMLRSTKMTQPQEDSFKYSRERIDELGSNRIFHYGKVEELWNTAISGHRSYSSRCHGRLEWNTRAEKQWGLGWIENLHCQLCTYNSPTMKLFSEVDAGRTGRKSGAMNRALQVGLSHCMIGNTSMRDILLALNIPAPSTSAMQAQSNSVAPVLEQLNREDMAARLENLIKVSPSILVEGDCRYNNALQTSAGKTPYQAGTQSVFAVSENVTSQKQVLAVVCKNKHCKVAQGLRRAGHQVTCPHHSGHCSANLQPTDPIGNEGSWAAEAFRDMFESCPHVSFNYFTTDGDSRAFVGLQQVQAEYSTVIPEHLRDKRHLTENMRFQVKGAKFTPEMFPGRLKALRDKQQHFFALELSKRCNSEFETCYHKCDGNLENMKDAMAHVPETLILCYQGDCSRCNEHSFICGSKKPKPWTKSYLPREFQIYPTESDEKLLVKLIEIRLGEDSLSKTKLNTTTQKSEAFNRTLTRCNPKCTTYKRNFPGRAHSAAHLVNAGIAKSTITKCAAVGAPLHKGSRAFAQLNKAGRKETYLRSMMKTTKYKGRRIDSRKKLYGTYFQKMDEVEVVHYQKGLLQKSNDRDDHSYAVGGRTFDGEYPSTSGVNTKSRGAKVDSK
jgi:hypothetical protein